MNSKDIIKNAPEGWTHYCEDTGRYFNLEYDPVEYFTDGYWENGQCLDTKSLESRKTIERFAELEGRVKYLEDSKQGKYMDEHTKQRLERGLKADIEMWERIDRKLFPEDW